MRELTQAQAIQEATDQCMAADESVILIGEGVPDGVFGTTTGLKEKYPTRVFDSPLSENAVTGVVVGAAISGLRPIMTHQRVEFSLLSMSQIIDNSAKWYYMFGKPVPMVLRCITGRGFGQGPQHSQSLQNLFAGIPGLRVVMPVSSYDSKGLMISAIEYDGPVIILEHRWLHNLTSEVPQRMYRCPLDKARILREGKDITILGFSYGVVESLKAHSVLELGGINAEVIDGVSAAPLDMETIIKSVKKTGRLVVVDTGHKTGSIGGEVVRQVCEQVFRYLRSAPTVVACADYPQPTSHFISHEYYPDVSDVVNACYVACGKKAKMVREVNENHDVQEKYVGPF